MQSRGSGRLYSADELCAVINSILHVVDNTERRNNEAELTRALQQPQNVWQLVTILCGVADGTPLTSASAGARQMAAVLLRKRVFSLWRALAPAQQQQLRQLLLQQLGSETARPVRFAIAHVVTRLAKADANRGGGGWPELQQAIRIAIEDARVDMRELAMVLLYSFGEVFAEENAFSGLAAESVVRGLGDNEVAVQAAAVKAAMVLLPALHEHPAVRHTFLGQLGPACVAVLQHGATVESRVPLCVSVLELLEHLFDDLTVKKYGSLLQELAQALIGLLANPQNHPRVRENCGAALGQLATLKPKFVATQHLLDPLVQVCLALMSEDNTISITEEGTGNVDGEDFDDDDDDADMLHVISSCMVGGRLLSALATTVSSKAFTAVLLPYIAKVTDAPASVGARTRKATMIALACLAEGNPSYLRRRVGYVLGVTQTLLRDVDPVPREAAAFALSYFCAHLQPEILLHRDELLPMLMPLLQDGNDLVRHRVAQALDTLCENLEENLDPFVPTLLPAVMAAIPISSLETQCRLCGVLSSMGMTGSTTFASHGPELLEVLRQPFTLNSPETMALRAQATETVGVVGAAMGRDAFAPYFPFFMQEVVANLQTRNAAVREQSFGFLANMCELFKDDFACYLNDSIRCALEAVEEDRTTYTNKHLLAKEEGGGGGSGGGDGLAAFAAWKDEDGVADGENDDEEEEDGGDDAEEIHLRVRTADVEEKSSAVYCIGVFADVLRKQLSEEQLAACWESLSGLDSHYYPNIRSNAFIALAKLAKASAGFSEEEMQARSKAAPPGQDILPPPVRDHIDELLGMLLRTIEEEDMEKEVVSGACEAVSILFDYFGTQCSIDGPDAVLRDVVQLLRGTMPCQRSGDDELNNSDDDDDDDDGAGGTQNMSYEEYQRRQQADPAAADRAYYAQGKDPFFRRADEAVEAQASAIMSAMMQHQQAGLSSGPPPQLPTAAELPPWYTLLQPEMVVHGVHLGDDHDEVVTDAAAEMLESVAKAYGPLLQPYMPFLVPLLALHADVETRPPEGLVMGVGTLAAVMQAYASVVPGQPNQGSNAASLSSEQLLAPFMDTAVQLSFSVMAGSDESTAKANSAYLLRILVEGCPAYFVQHAVLVPQCFQALWSIVGNEEEEIPEAVDNAVSATCSFVRCLPLQHLPLDQVIPSLMVHLPMKVDKAENANAIRTVCYLLRDQDAMAAATATTWLPAVVQAVANTLASRTVEDAEKQQLVQAGAAVFAQAHSNVWQQARQQSLSPEQQATLQAFHL